MPEHPEDLENGVDSAADVPTDGDSAPAAPSGPATPSAPSAPSADDTPPVPADALGVVEEQELIPEAESTIPQPGEALDDLLPALAATGHDGVDDALATLDDMAEKSVHEHVEVFDAVHEELRRTLDQAAEQQ